MPTRKQLPLKKRVPLSEEEQRRRFSEHGKTIENALANAMTRVFPKFANLFDNAGISREEVEAKARERIPFILEANKPGMDIEGYAYITFRNAIAKQIRSEVRYVERQKKAVLALLGNRPPGENPRQIAERNEVIRIIDHELAQLSERDKEIFFVYIDRLGNRSAEKEVAEIFGLTASGVKKAINRIRTKLRKNPALRELYPKRKLPRKPIRKKEN
ncbi:MAG: sigma-70 family RNA polymerase sigma factor [archaeon]|nr:sigma-70 family RNA polymerase sigma factor [archaeon]